MHFSYIVPVHNSSEHLESTVNAIAAFLVDYPDSEIVLIENGSSDNSFHMAHQLCLQVTSVHLRASTITSAQGLGFAYRRGIETATGDLLILTASDLPFQFTDVEAFLALPQPRPQLVIGSKAHPRSQVSVSILRRVMSWGFRQMNRLFLGLNAADTQGTLLIDKDLAKRILPKLSSGDYLCSTEIVAWSNQLGYPPVEVPITYQGSASSTVSPVRDSLRMAFGVISLARRIRRSNTQHS